ncbi:hypothetical protein AGR56_15670 [Clostridium sp. DMHC 10]|uniref:sigma factor n=1 Tax=Clostridium sp. DMHC 10 TaxID=747377 RepID=UPI00069DE64F|nr:sigma factor [Clostridium sp. DMHC 10]KOF57703.1 hypothetical protein AGR56_15670 [Clostridium sp. DMHC 10]
MEKDFRIGDINLFIEENMEFIYKTASFICKKKLDKNNDEEFSVAIEAFNKACETFSEGRGNFFSYAKVVIRNSLIDFFKNSSRTPLLYFDNEEGEREMHNNMSIDKYDMEVERKNRIDEINIYKKHLKQYDIDFFELSKNSPSHRDTRDEVLNVAILCVKNEYIKGKLEEKKRLPVTEIMRLTNKNRKFIEKWRRYLISLIIILSNDEFMYLKSYLNIRKEE